MFMCVVLFRMVFKEKFLPGALEEATLLKKISSKFVKINTCRFYAPRIKILISLGLGPIEAVCK